MGPPVDTQDAVKTPPKKYPTKDDIFSSEPVLELVAVRHRGTEHLIPKSVADASAPAINCHSDGNQAKVNGSGRVECKFSGYCIDRRLNGKAICTHWTPDALECAAESHKYAHPLGDDVYCSISGRCPNRRKVRGEKDLFTCSYLTPDDLR